MNDGYGEALERDSIRIGEVVSILLRNKLLIATVALLTTAAAIVWVGTRTPRYTASATLLLEEDEAVGGVLSELASLTSDPAAEAEIALLTSRSLAEVTVANPRVFFAGDRLFDDTEPDFDPFAVRAIEAGASLLEARAHGDPSAMEHLGLVTIVDRHDLRPFASIWDALVGKSSEPHRLRAALAPAQGAVAPPARAAFDVEFTAARTVRVAEHEGYVFPNGDGVEVAFEPGVPFDALGCTLTLAPTGDYIGRRYTVRYRTPEDAIQSLMASTSAVESGRKTNVVYVSVDDSDPYRAAETANALCKNYIRRSVRIGQQKASQTVRFIEAQLEVQLTALAEAERDVVRIQTEHPETIALSESAEAWIAQLSAFELEAAQLELAQTVLADALSYLEQENALALARLGQEVPNLLALSYIKELGQLESESLRLDRTDVAGYKALLIGERLRLETEIESMELRIGDLSASLERVGDGGEGVFASLAGTARGEFQTYLDELAELDAEISRLEGTATAENPALVALEGSRTDLAARLVEQVQGAIVAARQTVASHRALVADYAKSIAEWPALERGTIDEAVAALTERVRASLVAQSGGIADRLVALQGQMGVLERRLGELPASELELAEPMRRREARGQIVAFLLTANQEAKITAAATSAAAVLIDPAVPPSARSFPKATTFIGLGLVLGLLLGCGAALVHNNLRGALHSEAEVERATGLAVLGSVPDYLRGKTRVKGLKRGQRFLAMRDDSRGAVAEAYRSIRAALRLAMDGDDALRTLAVTSCVPGEGKTVTNTDLAMVFASSGKRVLFVDADLRKPQVHNVFEFERTPGFAEILSGTADWKDCVHDVGYENLSVIAAGDCKTEPGELLAGHRSLPVLGEFQDAFDLVVLDLPPAVVVADVANFAHKLDAVILLYRSGGVPGRVLTSAVSKLKQAEANVMGVIVNAVHIPRGPAGYGAAGYGYGYGYGEDESS